MLYLTLGVVYFVYVFFRSFQQRNVTLNHPTWVMPTSYMMALIDIYVISTIAVEGFRWGLVLAIGTGGGLGCLLAINLHRKLMKE